MGLERILLQDVDGYYHIEILEDFMGIGWIDFCGCFMDFASYIGFEDSFLMCFAPAGHGWGVDEDNCAEFCDHSHHFSVNGVTTGLTKAHPTAGNQDGCKTKADLQRLNLYEFVFEYPSAFQTYMK